MKGIMATLLALGLACAASGQQLRPDDRSFAGSNPSSNSLNQDDFSPTGSDLSKDGNMGGNDRSQLGPPQLLMKLDPSIINEFEIQGELSSEIDPRIRNQIGEILFGFAEPLAKAKDSLVFERIKPIGSENGALVFEFSDSELRAVENSTLRYRFSPAEIGQYDTVVVRRRGAMGRAAAQNDNAAFEPVARLNELGNQGGIQPPSSETGVGVDRNSATGLGSPTGFSSNKTFGLDQPNQLSNPLPNRFADRSATLGMTANEPQMDNWKSDLQDPRTVANTSDSLAIQRRLEHLANVERDLKLREQWLTSRELQQNRLSANPTTQLDSTLPSNLSSLHNQRLASSGSLGFETDRQIPTAQDTALLSLKSSIEQGFQGLNQTVNQLSSRVTAIESASTVDDPFQTSLSSGYLANRAARSHSPALRQLQAGIAGVPENSQNAMLNQNMSGPLYFMLICSIGLNIYLGLISRNFYVRYNELADELRETFSASVSS